MWDEEVEALSWARRVFPHPDERGYWTRLLGEYGEYSSEGIFLTVALRGLDVEESERRILGSRRQTRDFSE